MKAFLFLLIVTWLVGIWFLIYGFGLSDHHNDAGHAYLISGAIITAGSLITSGFLIKRK